MSNNLLAPDFRFRRLRRTTALRELVRETHLHMSDFILPIFVEEGITEPVAIASMPDVYRYPESQLAIATGSVMPSSTKIGRIKSLICR